MHYPRFVIDEGDKNEHAPIMGFSVARPVQEKIMELIGQEGWDPEEASLIPDCDGMVLVKYDSKAFHERRAKKEIFKIPFTIKGKLDGNPVEMKLFVCTT